MIRSADALAEIMSEEGEDIALVVILTIPSDDPGLITANLRGPLVISHKTKLGKQMYRKLKVYAGDKHPHQAQKPVAISVEN